MSPLTESTRVVLKQPTGASWTITPTNLLPDDADAVAYIAAVEAADGQALEPAVRLAINSFVKGCKADGIWPAIKASCILAGARTLDGALVPLVGAAPTNYNFVAGDYNRKNGITGNGTKNLDTNKNSIDEPQNSFHYSLYLSSPPSDAANRTLLNATGNALVYVPSIDQFLNQNRHAASQYNGNPASSCTGFIGTSRNNSADYIWRDRGVNTINNRASVAPVSANFVALTASCTYAFYSIGQSLDLALLDARVTTLINAFAAAIP